MKPNRMSQVDVVRYPVVLVTFSDGFSGEYDMMDLIARGPIFEPLRDEAYFAGVALAPYGHSFGWNLDQEGHEIDFCPDATRIHIEAAIVDDLADRYERQLMAAE